MLSKIFKMDPRWKEIIDTLSDGVMVVAADGDIVMVNRAFEIITGYSKGEVVGSSCRLINCDACDLARNSGQRNWCILFDEGRLTVQHCSIRTKDGSLISVKKDGVLLKSPDGKILGAVETLVDLSAIIERDQTIEELCSMVKKGEGFHGMIGDSRAMRDAFLLMEKAAKSEAPVIIYGETGTGKELAAQAVHRLGWRKEGPFIQLNCAALNESLLESELFGHVKGAFTGAYRDHKGRFEIADGGDIFLDEIADVPLSTQVKLLRVLESKQFERVGDHNPIKVDVRIIAATNRDLQTFVKKKQFREDLFFRINVIPIHLPPLRERREDIPALVSHFIRGFRRDSSKKSMGLSAEAMEYIIKYPWPGNVRELKSALEYAVVIADGDVITPGHLPREISAKDASKQSLDTQGRYDKEKKALLRALEQSDGNQTRAAEILGVSRVTVWHRMKKYGIDLKSALASVE